MHTSPNRNGFFSKIKCATYAAASRVVCLHTTQHLVTAYSWRWNIAINESFCLHLFYVVRWLQSTLFYGYIFHWVSLWDGLSLVDLICILPHTRNRLLPLLLLTFLQCYPANYCEYIEPRSSKVLPRYKVIGAKTCGNYTKMTLTTTNQESWVLPIRIYKFMVTPWILTIKQLYQMVW